MKMFACLLVAVSMLGLGCEERVVVRRPAQTVVVQRPVVVVRAVPVVVVPVRPQVRVIVR